MSDVQTIIEEAKKALGVESDNALAKELGITRASVSHWKHGRSLPDTITCATLAGLTGRPLAQVLGIVGEARAISREEKAVWRKLAATAIGLGIVVLAGYVGGYEGVQTALLSGAVTPSGLYIMRNHAGGCDSCEFH